MKIERKLLFVCFFVVVNFASADYRLIDLGTLGGIRSVAYSINDNGQIVGQASDASGNSYASLFDATGNGSNINLGTLGGTSSIAYSINSSGQIVGQASNILGNSHATLFSLTGNSDLGTLGGNNSVARSINSSGQIVGAADNTSSYSHAALFGSTGNVDLGTVEGGSYASIAYSVNDSTQIVGYSSDFQMSGYATLFDNTGSGKNIKLNIEQGAQAITNSNNNQIAGWDSYHTDPFPCIFDSTGSGQNWEWGPPYSYVSSINDNGLMVGGFEYSNYRGVIYHAAFFDPLHGNNFTDLNSFLGDDGSGWILNYAYDINNKGWIVGSGTYNGDERAFLLIIPEPATIILFGLGAALLLRRKP
jgi:probable HAF family extracellular repeat protein